MDLNVGGMLAPAEFSVRQFVPCPDIADSITLGWLSALILRTQAEDRLPSRTDISPRTIGPRAMPSVLMLDVVGRPPRFRLRLIGTALVRMSGRDNTGRYFDELAPQQREANAFYLRAMEQVTRRRKPALVTANLFYRDQEWVRFRALIAPFSSDGVTVDLLVAALEQVPSLPD